jgi:protein tyrosine/serine phosphatase
MRTVMAITAVVALAATIWLTREVQANRLVWDHFDVVKPGVLYRSGQLNAEQLEAATRRHGLKLVVSFQYPGKGVDQERATCERLGIEFLNLPMPGDGFGREEQFRQILAATDDPGRRPVLVHCARGTCRTGSSVAMYRFERDGWTPEDVAAEMRRQAYRDGWITGYIYNMVGEKPTDERIESMTPQTASSAAGKGRR